MANALVEHTVKSLEEFMSFVSAHPGKRVWYRGCGRSDYPLTPSLYRRPPKKAHTDLLKIEYEMLKRFRQRGIPYLDSMKSETNDLHILFLMQHYGVPTRLLDWTENPYIALYFALTGAVAISKAQVNKKFKGLDTSIWVLEPEVWNETAANKSEILSPPEEDVLPGYTPTGKIQKPEYYKEAPVALYGIHNSYRIVAQRGVFICFGGNLEPMETQYVQDSYRKDCLQKIIVPAESVEAILDGLMRIGIRDSVVFPDLYGLGIETKREFGFEVTNVTS